MYEFKVSSQSRVWWNFLDTIEAAIPDISEKDKHYQLAAVNDALSAHNGSCRIDPTAFNNTKLIANFDTEEDFIAWKLKYV